MQLVTEVTGAVSPPSRRKKQLGIRWLIKFLSIDLFNLTETDLIYLANLHSIRERFFGATPQCLLSMTHPSHKMTISLV